MEDGGDVTNQMSSVGAPRLQHVLGLSGHETAWTWLRKLRLAMVPSERNSLSGTVEVDQA
jgi:hypothetical protein